MFMNSGYTYLFRKWCCNLYFREKETNSVTLPPSAQNKHALLVERKEMSKTKKLPSRKKMAPELLDQRFGHRSIILLLDGGTTNLW